MKNVQANPNIKPNWVDESDDADFTQLSMQLGEENGPHLMLWVQSSEQAPFEFYVMAHPNSYESPTEIASGFAATLSEAQARAIAKAEGRSE